MDWRKLTLGALVAPVSKAEFLRDYWEQKPLIVHRGDPSFYGDLFTLQDFDEAITRSPDYVKMANAATKRNKSYKPSYSEGLEAVLDDMRNGGTLVLDQLQRREPKLALLCRLLSPETGYRFHTNLYLTPPNGKGFAPHWDNHDVFILQVVGSKRWSIEKQRRTLPVKREEMGDEGRELRGDVDSFTLEQGDLIYIPRGFVHAAECGSACSLHITLSVTAVFLQDLLHATIIGAIKRDENLRLALPPGFMRGGPQRLASRVQTVLRHLAADEEFLTGIVNQFRDELVKSSLLDISGQVAEFFEPHPLNAGDIVQPRRGAVYTLREVSDTVRVNFGARTIIFPDFLKETLEFALNTASYAVRDIPGDFDDEDKIGLAERLRDEGLIVRAPSS